MNRVQVILTLDMENLPSNFSDIFKAGARSSCSMERTRNIGTLVFKTGKKWCCFNFQRYRRRAG